MTKTDSTISIVLPAHNEAENIERVTRQCVEVAGKLFNDFEVLVVDDGSDDGTGSLVENLSRADPRIKLIRHETNRGYGAALRSGFSAASKDWVFFTDSDGQFDIAELADFIQLLSDSDIIAGYRIKRMDNIYRRFMGRLYTFLMDLLFGVGIKDVNCAFKFIRTDFLREITLTSEGALINTEIIAHARKKGLIIVQKGVHHYPRRAGEQSGGAPRVILKAIKEFLQLRREIC